METGIVLVIVDRDQSRRQQWTNHAARRHVTALVVGSANEAAAMVAAHPRTTLIVRCDGVATSDVLELVARVRAAEEPVPVLLLTDAGDEYRTALRARSLIAEVLVDTESIAPLLGRLGLATERSDREERAR